MYKRQQFVPDLNTPCKNPIYVYKGKNIFANGLLFVIPCLDAFLNAFNWMDGAREFTFDDDEDNMDRTNEANELMLDTDNSSSESDDVDRTNEANELMMDSDSNSDLDRGQGMEM